MLDNQFEQWYDIRDSLLYTRSAIPFRESDISFRNQTLLQKWCNIEFTPEQVFDANNEYEQFWRRSQHEQLNWRISDTRPIFYVWGNDEQPLFESRTILPNRIKLDFYDVLDVVYALQMKHLNGRFDYIRLKRFWDARLNAYHDADIM